MSEELKIILPLGVVAVLFLRDTLAAHRWKPRIFHGGAVVFRAQTDMAALPSPLPEPRQPVTFWGWRAEHRRLGPHEIAIFAKVSKLPLMAGLLRYDQPSGRIVVTGRLLWSIHLLLLVAFAVLPVPWLLFVGVLIYALLVYAAERRLLLGVLRGAIEASEGE